MLSVLISGTPRNDIDVFLDPLIDDLQLLFEEGVETYDAYAQEKFILRAVVLWTINDYPALGTLCGCPYSGFHGCVVCRKETQCCRLPFSSKQSYAGHRRYLPYNHPFRKQTKAFNGKQEWGTTANPMTGEEIFNENVAESIVGTLPNVPGKTKDGLNARLDLAHFGLKQELQAKKQGNKTILPAACYTLTKDEKDKFCETLYSLRVPQGYCSNFSSLVNRKDRKLVGLKSHDYHMLMQQFLPIAIRKEIKVEELDKLQEELCVTLCLLEKYFPPSFFDIMIHLTVHLTREVKLCGPICFRWMYPFERCMKVIKGHVRNKTYPEGCIAEENVAEETIEFFSEYQKNMKTIGIPPYKYKTSENDNGEGNPLSAGKPVLVSPELSLKAHFYVLQNTPEIVPYIEQHMTFLKNRHGGKPQAWLEKEHNTTFGHWLRNKVEKELAVSTESISETVKWISHGAHSNVLKYDVYEINGYTFRTKARDGGVYQNSGVGVEATDMHISKEVVTYRKNVYYGVLREIWVLDYHIKRIPLFLLGHKDDPFILASQARHVFYVKDQLDKKMSIVFMTPPKNYRDSYDDVDEETSTVIFPHNDNILPRVDPLDMGNESRDDYYRTDCNV
ncbi:uncharacterized protein LOC118490404 [Helianthus annuus]|uniref:uncharacterized protein LOC118490404 n=1 Tax=Helianthus annuus TaxID=4232 RepID=UPI0016533FB3|nr:uncharacterized protein LOC118490404 [Helianthus annuus]